MYTQDNLQRDFLADSKKAASRNLRGLAITAGPPGPPCPTVALLRDTVEDEEAQTRLVLILCTERDLLVCFLGSSGAGGTRLPAGQEWGLTLSEVTRQFSDLWVVEGVPEGCTLEGLSLHLPWG